MVRCVLAAPFTLCITMASGGLQCVFTDVRPPDIVQRAVVSCQSRMILPQGGMEQRHELTRYPCSGHLQLGWDR